MWCVISIQVDNENVQMKMWCQDCQVRNLYSLIRLHSPPLSSGASFHHCHHTVLAKAHLRMHVRTNQRRPVLWFLQLCRFLWGSCRFSPHWHFSGGTRTAQLPYVELGIGLALNGHFKVPSRVLYPLLTWTLRIGWGASQAMGWLVRGLAGRAGERGDFITAIGQEEKL